MKTIIDNILVIKVGTSTLTATQPDGQMKLDIDSFYRIGKQVVSLQEAGYHIVIVSSAAITAGMASTSLIVRPSAETDMPNLQRLASIGWRHILNAWSEAMKTLTLGELLLTKRELNSNDERAEALRVTYELMIHGNIPIVNENDAIAHEEIAFGDNDTLAAIFAAKMKRSTLFGNNVSLVILSDIEGVYANADDKSDLIKEIDDIDAYTHIAKAASGSLGTGGMVTKFTAAKIAHQQAVPTYIAYGRMDNVIEKTLRKETGTHFTI